MIGTSVPSAVVASATNPGEDSTQMEVTTGGPLTLSAGDQITVKAKKIGTAGPSVSVSLLGMSLIRLGAEIGA